MYLKIYFPAKNMNEKLETKIPIIRNVIDTIEYFHKYYSRTLKKKKKKRLPIFLSFHFQGNKIEIKFNDIRCYYETKSVQKDRARKRRGGGRVKRIRFAGAEAKKDGSNKREVRRGSE